MAAGVVWRAPDAAPLAAIAATVFGPVYTAGLPSFLLVLRHGAPDAPPLAATWLVFYPLAMTWICDSAAMSGGAAFGGPKMAPVLSPQKTWSGAASGLAGALITAVVYAVLALAPTGITLQVWQMLVLGATVGIFGQLGDLAESLLKRSVGIKDSGTFFPGHGGVLDRLDSLYWVIPLSTLLMVAFGIL
jgi:phosphatidate cytidylyltransferase